MSISPKHFARIWKGAKFSSQYHFTSSSVSFHLADAKAAPSVSLSLVSTNVLFTSNVSYSLWRNLSLPFLFSDIVVFANSRSPTDLMIVEAARLAGVRVVAGSCSHSYLKRHRSGIFHAYNLFLLSHLQPISPTYTPTPSSTTSMRLFPRLNMWLITRVSGVQVFLATYYTQV